MLICNMVRKRCQAASPLLVFHMTDHQKRKAVTKKQRCCRRWSETLSMAASKRTGACQAQIAAPCTSVATVPLVRKVHVLRTALLETACPVRRLIDFGRLQSSMAEGRASTMSGAETA